MKIITTFKYQPHFSGFYNQNKKWNSKNLEHNKLLKLSCRDDIYFPTIWYCSISISEYTSTFFQHLTFLSLSNIFCIWKLVPYFLLQSMEEKSVNIFSNQVSEGTSVFRGFKVLDIATHFTQWYWVPLEVLGKNQDFKYIILFLVSCSSFWPPVDLSVILRKPAKKN